MAENKLADMSTEFAIQILKLTDGIKGHYSLSNQLERSGTSIGANIREAKYAHSRPDFIAKLQIALKECYETEYWIEIAQKADIISADIAKIILHDCGSIRRIYGTIIIHIASAIFHWSYGLVDSSFKPLFASPFS